MSTDIPAPPRSRLLENVLEAFDEGARSQRAARIANGMRLVDRDQSDGMTALGRTLRGLIAAIPWDDSALHEEFPNKTPDGGPFCPSCLGVRWQADRSIPGWTTKLSRCPDCRDATAAEWRTKLASLAGLSQAQRVKTFTTWAHVKAAGAALKATSEWATRWAVEPEPDETPWLVLSGERGAGKTHLSLAAANCLIGQSRRVRWFHTIDLVDLARSKVGEGAAFAFRRELESDVPLILDEFGALSTMGTDWAVTGFMEPLLDTRYRNRAPTLFTLKGGPADVRTHISQSIGRRMEDADICLWIRNEAPQFKRATQDH